MRYSTHVRDIALGSMGVIVAAALSGCVAEQEESKNRFLVIEQNVNGTYSVIEEHPTDGESRAIIRERDENGRVTERFINEAEMKALAEQEYQRVQEGTSETIQPDNGEGMGLAGTILAVAAGSLLGNMIANQLMGNKNFSQNADRVNRSAYHANKKAMAKNAKKSFFGSSKSSTTTSKSSTWSSKSSGWGG